MGFRRQPWPVNIPGNPSENALCWNYSGDQVLSHDYGATERFRGCGYTHIRDNGPVPPHLFPTDEEFDAALVLHWQYLQLPMATNLDISTPLGDVIVTVQTQLSLGTDARSAQLSAPFPIQGTSRK
jgi:hypothetical protein